MERSPGWFNPLPPSEAETNEIDASIGVPADLRGIGLLASVPRAFARLDTNERSLQVWPQNLLHCMTAFWCGA